MMFVVGALAGIAALSGFLLVGLRFGLIAGFDSSDPPSAP